MGGHAIIHIDYQGCRFVVAHSHGGFEMGGLVAEPLDEKCSFVPREAVLLGRKHERLLIRSLKKSSDADRDRAIGAIRRFSKSRW